MQLAPCGKSEGRSNANGCPVKTEHCSVLGFVGIWREGDRATRQCCWILRKVFLTVSAPSRPYFMDMPCFFFISSSVGFFHFSYGSLNLPSSRHLYDSWLLYILLLSPVGPPLSGLFTLILVFPMVISYLFSSPMLFLAVSLMPFT